MNYKAIIGIIIFTVSAFAFGQEFPTQKTDKHIHIAGTNIYMNPPQLFEPSSNFKGFQDPNDQNSMIMVIEIPGSFFEVSKGFNSELLEKQGMELKAKKEIKVSGLNGVYLEVDQSANGITFSKKIIAYGNEKSSTIINGVYLKDAPQLGEQIKESLLSTFVETKTEADPRKALTYTIDESVGSLKFLTVMGNTMLFNRDLKTPTESSDKATVLTEKSFAKIEIKNKKSFCISRVGKYPYAYSIITDKGINEIEIDNLKGYELFAKNNDKEGEEIYQVILFENNGGYYILYGSYASGSNQAITDIKRIIRTFKRKS